MKWILACCAALVLAGIAYAAFLAPTGGPGPVVVPAQTARVPAVPVEAPKPADMAQKATKAADAAVQAAAKVAGSVATGAAEAVKQAVKDAVSVARDGSASAAAVPPPAPLSWTAAGLTLDQIKSRIANAAISESDRLQFMAEFKDANGQSDKLQALLDKLRLAISAAKTGGN